MFFLPFARKNIVSRYVPLYDLQAILEDELGDSCNVKKIIHEYLDHQKKTTEADDLIRFRKNLEEKNNKANKKYASYNISSSFELLNYESINTVDPETKNLIVRLHSFCKDFLTSQAYKMKRPNL